ncbi:MAG: ABC transporter permease [Eubacteriales bacterium]|nr:ABC transporter permease [Eubacteriales bacterium]
MMKNRRKWIPIFIGAVILIFFLVIALFAEQLMPYQMNELSAPYGKPSAEHWLGTNDIGQDIFSELILGTRVTLLTGVMSAFFIICIGTGFGLVAGYYGGKADRALSAVTSVFMAIPQLPFTIVLVTFLEPSMWNIVVAICLTAWTTTARIVRAKVIEIRQQPFVQVEEALGQKKRVILFHHILPNIQDIVLMRATLAVSSSMLTEASLSFLGLGAYNQKSWGAILFYAFRKNGVVAGYYWWYVPPILCISLCIFAFMLIGYYGLGSENVQQRKEYQVDG